MTIFIVDEKAEVIRIICDLLSSLHPDAEVLCFNSSPQALAEAREREIDIAFLNPVMPELSGIHLGQYLREMYPMVNLIYMTDSTRFGYDAISQHASGYLVAPFSAEGLLRELGDLRYPPAVKGHKRVFAQTFGNFEFFVDGKPVEFKYSRTKEIVALLVNRRGAQTTNGEIIATLWEDDGDPAKKASYLSNLRQDLQNSLASLHLNGIIIKKRGSLAIAVDKIECDVYDWLEKKQNSRYHYLGEYMSQYSWAEYTAAELDEISYSIEGDTWNG